MSLMTNDVTGGTDVTVPRGRSRQLMRRAALPVLGVLGLLAFTPGQASASMVGPQTSQIAAAAPMTINRAFTARVVVLTNAQRKVAHCGALTVNYTLNSVAQAHSEEMARYNYFSHTSRDGKSPAQRLTSAKYVWQYAAENIAAGQTTPEKVVAAWMASPGHRANILNCKLTQIGVGYVSYAPSSYKTYWTQDFGTPRR